jgi:hypothetical protein
MEIYAYGPYKADLIRAAAAADGVDLDASFAYSDSYTDLPMLEIVGHPVVVNPDRVLAKVARERDWMVRQFVRPVRLRDRVPVTPVRATAAAGVSVGVAAAALTLWRARVRQRVARPVPPAGWERPNGFWGVSRSGACGRRRPKDPRAQPKGAASSWLSTVPDHHGKGRFRRR